MSELRIESDEHRVAVHAARAARPILVHTAPADGRPYLHPIEAPDGAGSVTEDRPGHHPWQHGLYIGLNDVNGVGFWSEGLAPGNAATDGSFASRVLDADEAAGRASWSVATDYLDPGGERMFRDRQHWSLRSDDGRLELRLAWTLTADRALAFGRYDYGGLFLRMPFRPGAGGSAIDSEGSAGPANRARWVAVTMPLPETGRVARVALLDHPQNLEHPVPWRIDHQLGVGPSPSIAGPWELAAGASREFGYGVVVGGADLTDDEIDARWSAFAKEHG
ncbi:PmoA family protein [Galbitalea sp. SE-J8]|uniref:DUF6807 domain-containing protein n=1 Tax=Galbitalea sp. SE-J8 TaxID=3054952 RepID=UPI00259C8AFE|nr:PmoA family protein [Galbitalea sp. SE-J8]MDM4762038.1 PmoA family protein [Galbitalea sp. SE-J8]